MTRYLGYSSLKDFFPTMDIKPNPGCANSLCCKLQQAYRQHQASPEAQQQRQAAQQAAALQQEEAATHDDNEWGIEVVLEPASVRPEQQSALDNVTRQQNRSSYDHSLPEGLQYETPVSNPSPLASAWWGCSGSDLLPNTYHACSVSRNKPDVHAVCISDDSHLISPS